MESKMYCYQCQETAGCSACTVSGVCGKSPETANLQDLLMFATRNLARVTTALRAQGAEIDNAVNYMVTENLFVTITNANFDNEAISARIGQTVKATLELNETAYLDPTGMMGSSTEAVMVELGYTKEEIDAAMADGSVCGPVKLAVLQGK